MTESLVRPIYSALATRHAALGLGGDLAKRFLPSISPFACSRDESAEAVAALAGLVEPGDGLVFLQGEPVVLPDVLVPEISAEGVQLIAESPVASAADPEIVRLGPADAADMLALATIAQPGPFTLEAQRLGAFWGIRRDGALVAMAGERLGQPGFTEVSGVATHPDFRGLGLARRLSLRVAADICTRGERPFLHAYAANAAAIALYRSIGFAVSRPMYVCFARRSA